MGWNRDYNDYNDRGWNGGGRDYRRDDRRQSRPPRRDWNQGGYGRPDHYQESSRDYSRDYSRPEPPKRDFLYQVGQKLSLRDFPDTVVSVIRIGNEQYECRLPTLQTQWFYEDELVPLENN